MFIFPVLNFGFELLM